MTTQEPTAPVTEPTTEPADPEPTGEGNAQLRDARDRAITKADGLTKELVEVRLGQIGLSPDEGLGIAIAESFKGEPTLEEIQTFASEKYKYTFDPANAAVNRQSAGEKLAEVQANEGQNIMNVAQSAQPEDERMQQAYVADKKILDGEEPTQREIESGIAGKLDLAR